MKFAVLMIIGALTIPASMQGVYCPPHEGEATKERDLDGDNTKDWRYNNETIKDEAGNVLERWCLDHGRGSSFVFMYVAAPGEPGEKKNKYIGYCEFAGGDNTDSSPQETIDGKKRFKKIKWTNSDVKNTSNLAKREYEFDPRTCKLTQTTVRDDGSVTTQSNVDPPMESGGPIGLPLRAQQNNLLPRKIPSTYVEVQGGQIHDNTPPQCYLVGQGTGYIEILTQDTGSGLSKITVTRADNADVPIPPFSPGIIEPVIVTATKIDPNQRSRVDLEVLDEAGNVTRCDPVITLVTRDRGKPTSETINAVPQEENKITLYNGTPGLGNLLINVNGRRFRTTDLGNGEERTIDVSSAMLPGSRNTIILTAQGKPGGSATVVIHD
ncbi:MAG TPA: hypothetical protein VHC97_02510 [Thermoanaerobaculia bacterium]|jgi:hypothetical protein|nr:hypothetical protein [Thermoanaerobaculia bacterium]